MPHMRSSPCTHPRRTVPRARRTCRLLATRPPCEARKHAVPRSSIIPDACNMIANNLSDMHRQGQDGRLKRSTMMGVAIDSRAAASLSCSVMCATTALADSGVTVTLYVSCTRSLSVPSRGSVCHARLHADLAQVCLCYTIPRQFTVYASRVTASTLQQNMVVHDWKSKLLTGCLGAYAVPILSRWLIICPVARPITPA